MATPIQSLFSKWADAHAEAVRTGKIAAEQALVDRILAAPAQDDRDFAAKIIAVCGWDDDACFFGQRAAALLAEARALVVRS